MVSCTGWTRSGCLIAREGAGKRYRVNIVDQGYEWYERGDMAGCMESVEV